MSDKNINRFENETEEEKRARRAKRLQQMKLEKEREIRRRAMIKKNFKYIVAVAVFILILLIFLVLKVCSCGGSGDEAILPTENQDSGAVNISSGDAGTGADNPSGDEKVVDAQTEYQQAGVNRPVTNKPAKDYHLLNGDAAGYISSENVISSNAIFINNDTGEVIARKDSSGIISPASMTKVLTVLIAAEYLEENEAASMDDNVEITLEYTDYAYINDCSSVGFLDGEVVTVRDLFYGTVLPSGGDAAVALACYVAGSHENFVELMNAKLDELGVSNTAHFTNCVGLYDKQHYCTTYDMAVIMRAAMDNDICREVMSAHTYTTSCTTEHPEGITISNWFLRRIEDKDTGGEVLCAKTGFVNQSGSCAVSFGVSDTGVSYICVTAGSSSSWRCIYDQVELYNLYGK